MDDDFTITLDHLPLAAVVVTAQGRPLAMNRKAKRLLGWETAAGPPETLLHPSLRSQDGRGNDIPLLPPPEDDSPSDLDAPIAPRCVTIVNPDAGKTVLVRVDAQPLPLLDKAGPRRLVLLSEIPGIPNRRATVIERQRRRRLIMDNSQEIVTELDETERILYTSPQYRTVLGFPPNSSIPPLLDRMVHPDDYPGVKAEFEACFRSPEEPRRARFRVRRQGGGWRWMDAVGRAYLGTGGRPRLVATLRDVTELAEALEVLTAREERYRLLFNRTVDAIFVTVHDEADPPGGFLEVNDVACRWLGYSRDQFLTMSIPDIDKTADVSRIVDHLRENRHALFETELLSRNGRRIPVEVNAHLFDHRGRTLVLSVARDISDRKETLASLREVELRFRQVADNIRDVFWIRDLETRRMLFISRAYKEIWGRPEEELYVDSTAFMRSVHPDDLELVRTAYQRQMTHGTFFNETYRIVRPDGDIRWIRARNWPVADETGRPYRLVGLAEDVTAKHQAEEALVQAKEAAESASRTKSEFLANVSHEFRTPLNAILGFAGVVLDSGLTPQQQEDLGQVEAAARKLMELVNDLIEITRLEAEDIRRHPQPFDLDSLCRAVLAEFSPSARNKGLVLEHRVSSRVPNPVVGDVRRIQRVLEKLMENAVKFTEIGRVALEVDAEPVQNETVKVAFTVRDTGVGVPPDRIKALFEDFTQADGSNTRRYSGLGLGLTLARRLVDLLGGTIRAESAVGQGSVFSVGLPLGLPGSED